MIHYLCDSTINISIAAGGRRLARLVRRLDRGPAPDPVRARPVRRRDQGPVLNICAYIYIYTYYDII